MSEPQPEAAVETIQTVDSELRRPITIRRLRDPGAVDIELFEREARIQARVAHRAVPAVYEIGRDPSGWPYIVTQRVTCVPLASALARGPATPSMLRGFADACFAVAISHATGVLHRNLTTSTVCVGELGQMFVTGWGDAKVLVDTEEEITGRQGVPAAAKPDVDGRDDVYALGCILRELLARQPEIAPELEALCAAATQPEREQRLRSARELAERLAKFLDGDRDLVLRRERAQVHFDRAAALADSDYTSALREASRAVGLDPTHTAAAQLLGRMLITEPPTHEHVAQVIAREEAEMSRRAAVYTMFTYFSYLLVAPAFLWLASGIAFYALLLVAIVLFNILVLVYQSWVDPRPRPLLLILGHVPIVVLAARGASTFLIAPALAGVTATAIVMNPAFVRVRWFVVLVIAMIGAVLGSWLGEVMGWLPVTTTAIPDGLQLVAPALHLKPGGQMVMMVFFVVTLVTTGALYTRALTTMERTRRHRLHMQTWKLRQLAS